MKRTSRGRVSAGLGAAAVLAVGIAGGGPVVATVTADVPVADVLAEAGYVVGDLIAGTGAVPAGQGVLTYSAVVTLTPGSTQPTLSEVTISMQPVDANGSAASAARVVSDAAIRNGRGATTAAVDCAWRGPKRHRVATFAPTRVSVATPIGELKLANAIARAAGTGDVVGQPQAAQWVGCVAGGAILGEGFRVLQAGGGLAYRDEAGTAKFGMAWKGGEAPGRYEFSSAFPVGYSTKGAMVGSVAQVPGGKLLGSFSAPATNPTGPFTRNAVHAYWQDPCVDEVPCPGTAGDRGFHGATGHAAWALPGDGPRVFLLTGYVRYACADIFAAPCR